MPSSEPTKVVVVNTHPHEEKNPNTAHVWDISQPELPGPVWASKEPDLSGSRSGITLKERPVVVRSQVNGRLVYLGLNVGNVHEVLNLEGGAQQITTYASRFSDYTPLRGRARDVAETALMEGIRSIRGFAFFKGNLVDASFAGVFHTKTGEKIDGRRFSSLEIHRARLVGVPVYNLKSIIYGEPYGDPSVDVHPGSLVDVFSKEVIMKDLTPFDGSGFRQADYFLTAERAYVLHGDYPSEKLTIRDANSGEVIHSTPRLTAFGFLKHNGHVYHFRSDSREERPILARSDPDKDQAPLYKIPSGWTFCSALSLGDEGILISSYDATRKMSRVVNHLTPEEIVLEAPGVLELYKA